MKDLYEKMNAFYLYLDSLDMYQFVVLLVIAYFAVLLMMAAWFALRKEKHPLKDCAKCGPGGSTFFVPSLYDGSKKICPDCADEEWKNRPQSAPSLL